MKANDKSPVAAVLRKHEIDILAEWVAAQSRGGRRDAAQEAELRALSKEFLAAVVTALHEGSTTETGASNWSQVRELLAELSGRRATQGYSPAETATFVFSLKQPIFARLRKEVTGTDALADAFWEATLLIDSLGLYTTEAFQKSREQVIQRQQRELLELSTPVVELWQGIVALPLIGTLDSGRTQVVMESLLEKVVSTGASIAIIDITGVPTVDTLVAQHLMKTVAAARLMGADCIISGIRPQIAQTIVHLGVDLSAVTTKASLGDAFRVALQRAGSRVAPAETQAA
ncbi:MAG TPA: STAS domain-containing protein [Usitatibacter sp.]|nr:STAS domain-containing protein [Usitatibacter sp.]